MILYLLGNSGSHALPEDSTGKINARETWSPYHMKIVKALTGGTTLRDKQQVVNWAKGTGFTTSPQARRFRKVLDQKYTRFNEQAHKAFTTLTEQRQQLSRMNVGYSLNIPISERDIEGQLMNEIHKGNASAFDETLERFRHAQYEAGWRAAKNPEYESKAWDEMVKWQKEAARLWQLLQLGNNTDWPAYF